jgi:PAS domain-containing protein
MVKVTGRTLPWAILLALVFGAIILYFAAMLEVTGRISKEQDGLEMLSKKWLRIELELSEEVQPDSRIGSPGSQVSDFQRQLAGILDLPWLSVLGKAYPQPRVESEALRVDLSDLATRVEQNLLVWPDFKAKAVGIEHHLDSLRGWIDDYTSEQTRAFRVLLVFLASSIVLGAVLLLGFGNLVSIQEARFLAAIDSMSDALILTDSSNAVIHANPAAGRLFGVSADRLEGRPGEFPIPLPLALV